jgi:hypothetical protein
MESADLHPVSRPIRALGLLSGGLDSQLALCVIRDQGVKVEAVFFESPFCDAGRARQAAAALGVYLHVVDFTPDILELLRDPPHGFGSCLNPCVDCHARMLKRTGGLMEDLGYHFVFTGEVLNQRPMSQRRETLGVVARDSGFADRVVRPLSAGHLKPTLPEREGWLDRSRLLSLEGRSRKPQMALALAYKLKSYPTPAGGCRLTEPNFCRRLDDLRRHGGITGTRSVELLKAGRHFRLNDGQKIVVGRNAADNETLERSADLYDALITPTGVTGATVLVPLPAEDADLLRAAAIGAHYSHAAPGQVVDMQVRTAAGVRTVGVLAAERREVEALMIV